MEIFSIYFSLTDSFFFSIYVYQNTVGNGQTQKYIYIYIYIEREREEEKRKT